MTAASASVAPSLFAATKELHPQHIIDTHTHFYDPTRAKGVPWPPKNDALLYRKVMPADCKALAVPIGVTGTVVVEASAWVEDNQWILDLAANEKFIVGFVGHLTPGDKDFAAQVQGLAKNRLFRGIRIGGAQLQKDFEKSEFQAGLKTLADHDLSLDVLGNTPDLPFVARAAAKHPSLRIIVNHVANLHIDGKAPPSAWTDGMREAGQHRHVFCKVSGLVEGTGLADSKAPANVDFYRPVLDGVWNSFGAERLIHGSNWPVSERFASYATVQNLIMDYFRAKGQKALDDVFWKNAAMAYKWLKR